ncbi:MAG: SOS response-associated peptidase [Candidatus Roizmanbacteria bacterium]|nr:SOS response-associated peptidase [Candidatus Roizmanbacteria bacterium]
MCGRFSLKSTMKAIEEEFSIEQVDFVIEPRYNIAPTQNVAVIVQDETRKLTTFRWGLIPSWAKDPIIGNRMINARAETISEKPGFKTALKKRRCLILSDGFYEWKKTVEDKIPTYIFLNNHKPFAFAGLWDVWKTPEGKSIFTCTIITTTPNELIAPIHNRMPVILQKRFIDFWLDTSYQKETELINILKPYPHDEMVAHEVSKLVNSPKNDNPGCITKV